MSKYSNTRLIKPSQTRYIDTGDLSNPQKPKFYNNILIQNHKKVKKKLIDGGIYMSEKTKKEPITY